MRDLEVVLATPEASHTFDGRSSGRAAAPPGAASLGVAPAPAACDPPAGPGAGRPADGGPWPLLKGKGVAGKLAWAGLAAVLVVAVAAGFRFAHNRRPAGDARGVALIPPPGGARRSPRSRK